jgi:hypothetical protein
MFAMEAEVDFAGSDHSWNRVGCLGAYRYLGPWKCGAKSLQERGQLKIKAETLQDAKAQLPANDSILGANCVHGALKRRKRGTSMRQKQHAGLSNSDLARGAFDEPGPEFFFQLLDRV